MIQIIFYILYPAKEKPLEKSYRAYHAVQKGPPHTLCELGVTLNSQKQVKVKFDDNDVIEQKWFSPSDKTALFHPRPKQMFQQMMAAKKLELETVSAKNEPVSAIFSLRGLSLASHELRKNCNTKPG